jgi:hypothetical protein
MGESPGAHPAPWPTPLPAPLPGQPAWGGFSYNVVARFQHSPKQARAARHAVVTQKSPAKPHAGNNSTVVTVPESEAAETEQCLESTCLEHRDLSHISKQKKWQQKIYILSERRERSSFQATIACERVR